MDTSKADKARNEHLDEHIKGLQIALESADSKAERDYILKLIAEYEAAKIAS